MKTDQRVSLKRRREAEAEAEAEGAGSDASERGVEDMRVERARRGGEGWHGRVGRRRWRKWVRWERCEEKGVPAKEEMKAGGMLDTRGKVGGG